MNFTPHYMWSVKKGRLKVKSIFPMNELSRLKSRSQFFPWTWKKRSIDFLSAFEFRTFYIKMYIEPKLQSFFQLDLESVYVLVMKFICRIGKWGWDIMNQTHNLEAKTLSEMDFPEGNPPHRPPWPWFFLG